MKKKLLINTIISVCFFNLFYAQNSGVWTTLGSGANTRWSSTAGTVDILASATNYGTGTGYTLNDFLTNDTMGRAGAYSEPTIGNNPSLSVRHTFPNTATITFDFSTKVVNPVLHLDRLGGGQVNNLTSSSLITILTPGITFTELSENDVHFITTSTTVGRHAGQTYTGLPSECGPASNGTASGSVRLNGVFSTITFEVSMDASGTTNSVNDRWELAFSNMTPVDPCDAAMSGNLDSDGDGVSNICDLDNDNDGILDSNECLYKITPLSSTSNLSFGDGSVSGTGTYINGPEQVNYTITTTAPGALQVNTGEEIYLIREDDSSNGRYTITFEDGIELHEFFVASVAGFRNVRIGDFTIVAEDGTTYNNANFEIKPYSVNAPPVDSSNCGPMTTTLIGGKLYAIDAGDSNSQQGCAVLDFSSLITSKRIISISFHYLSQNYESIVSTSFGIISNLSCDTDGDGISNYLDIDSDDDGIPDNVEAQPSIGYVMPTGTVNSITGVDNAYTGGLALEDTDGDGIYDCLDNNSDNDVLLDIQENGDVNSLSGLDSDNDGLDNNFDDVTSSYDVNDEVSTGNPTDLTNAFGDADGDLLSGGDLDYRDLFNVNPPSSATIDFDGVDDYLFRGGFLDGLDEVTIMAWIKIDSGNASEALTTVAGEGDACRLVVKDGNVPGFGIYTSSGGSNVYPIETIKYNEWHHITGRFSNTNGSVYLYVDGELVSGANFNNLIGKKLTTSFSAISDFSIGRKSTNHSNKEYFDGAIDEVRVFNRALTNDQIQRIVYQEIQNNVGKVKGKMINKDIVDITSSNTISWSSLLAYYPMTDIINNKTNDHSQNSRDIVLMNITSVQPQTAPMPYETINNGAWTTESTWLHGDVWDIEDVPNNKDWSIVNIKDNVTTSNSHTNIGLIIDSNKSLTVNGDNQINNTWLLELNGTLDLKNDSQLIQNSYSDLVTSSNGKILRRQEGNSSVYWYNYWGSPVGVTGATTLSNNNSTSNNNNNSSFNVGLLKKPNGSNFQFTNAYDETGKISTRWLYTYINGVTYYDWAFLNPNDPLQPGVGYTSKGTGISGSEQQYVFEGKPNNGTILIPVTDTGGNGSIPAVSKTDYLLGNPYPSAIDIHEFIDDNIGVIDGTIQLWQQWSGDSHILDEYNGGYAQVNKTGAIRAYQFVGIEGATNGNQDGTKVPTRYLPVGQGFMTEIVADGNIVFNNDQRIFIKESDANGTYGSGSVFFRGNPNPQTSTEQDTSDSEESVMQKIRIEFNSVDGPQTRRELLLGFSENTSDGYDYGYEAKNTEENDDDLNLVMANDRYTIQAYSIIEEDKVVPLMLNASGVYNYTIKLTETENISEDQEIYLKDNLTNTYYNLREGEPYEFLSEAGEFSNRLEIVFQGEAASLSQTDEIIEDLDMYYAIGRKKMVILNPNNKAIKQIDVVNMLGQSVYTINNVFEGRYNEYDLHNLNTGAYVISLTTDSNTVLTKKIIVK